MCWDQGPAPRKLSLWLKAVIRMGSEWALALVMAQKPNTCLSPVPVPINTIFSSIQCLLRLWLVWSTMDPGDEIKVPALLAKGDIENPWLDALMDGILIGNAIILSASTWYSLFNLNLLLFIIYLWFICYWLIYWHSWWNSDWMHLTECMGECICAWEVLWQKQIYFKKSFRHLLI